jgi:hypothetical protein
MGSSESTTNNTSVMTNTNVTTSNISMLNSQTNNMVSNVIMKAAQSCSTAAVLKNTVTLQNLHIKGNLNINSKQKNKASVTFSCVQVSKMASNIEDSISNFIAGEINNKFSAEQQAKLAQEAKAEAAASALALGAVADSKSNNNSTITNTNLVTINQDIKNILVNNVTHNTNMESVAECVGSLTASNNFDLDGAVVGGDANIALDQDNAIELVTECIQNSDLSSGAITKTAQMLGIKISNDSSTSQKSTAEQIGSSSATTGFGGCSSQMMIMIIISCVVVVVVFKFVM